MKMKMGIWDRDEIYMYIIIFILIPNLKIRIVPVPILVFGQCGGFPIKLGMGSNNTHKNVSFVILIQENSL